MLGSYDYRLVALSVVIAGLAAYAALDLAGRVTSARGAARPASKKFDELINRKIRIPNNSAEQRLLNGST